MFSCNWQIKLTDRLDANANYDTNDLKLCHLNKILFLYYII